MGIRLAIANVGSQRAKFLAIVIHTRVLPFFAFLYLFNWALS